jgi:hypothetical protein
MVIQLKIQEQEIQQIADMLLLNGTLTECPGLVHGKMGIAVFFFHYAQFTGNELFADYAMDLMGEMMNQLHVNSPADYEKGIAGIGFGIDYLIQNKFLVPEDDICEDFDGRMVRAVMYDPRQDFSLYNGLTGYGRYWMTRLRYLSPSVQAQECLMYITERITEKLPDISVKEQADVYCFLHDLQRKPGFEFCKELAEQCRYFNDSLQDKTDLVPEQISPLDMNKPPVGTGLLSGYAGEAMLRLTALGQINRSWMHLL